MGNYKKLVIIPVALFIIALIVISVQYAQTGDIMAKDVSLKGGISSTVYTETPVDITSLETALQQVFSDVKVRTLTEFGTSKQIGVTIDVSETNEDELKKVIEEETGTVLTDDNFSIEVVGSALGESFYNQMLKAILLAFVLMIIVVFITFRSFIPSIAVVLAALFDIIITLAIVNVIGMQVSTAGIAALLLLIGYSIDTDIVLTTRVLKRKEGELSERLFSAMKTGLTMTVTTLAALGTGYVVAQSAVFKEMFLIILIGLVIDVIITYAMNAPIILSYVAKKEGK